MISITEIIHNINVYLTTVLGGNEFAVGAIMAAMGSTGLYLARSLPRVLYRKLLKTFTVQLTVNSCDDGYYKLVSIFINEKTVDKSRYLKLINGRWGDENATLGIGYGSQIMFYKHKLVHISISKIQNQGSSTVLDTLVITVFGRSNAFFKNLLEEIRTIDQKPGIDLYQVGRSSKQFMNTIHSYDMSNIILANETKQQLIKTLDKFTTSEEWYRDHGIPYHLGILLEGPPGTGKTTLVKAIASYLGRDLVLVDTVSDLKYANEWSNGKDLVLVEEIDMMLVSGSNSKRSDKDDYSPASDSYMDILSNTELKTVLTMLDGVASSSGRVIVATTNHIDKLVKPLLRPGRFDLVLHIGHLTDETFNDLLSKFFDTNIPNLRVKPDVSPAMVQNDILGGASILEIVDKYTINNER